MRYMVLPMVAEPMIATEKLERIVSRDSLVATSFTLSVKLTPLRRKFENIIGVARRFGLPKKSDLASTAYITGTTEKLIIIQAISYH